MNKPKPTEAQIRRAYAHHRPQNRNVELAHAKVREILGDAAVALNEVMPAGRYHSLALTALEQARTWANTAVALDSDSPDSVPDPTSVGEQPTSSPSGSPGEQPSPGASPASSSDADTVVDG